MLDNFKGKVYPFLHSDHMEPTYHQSVGSYPALFLFPVPFLADAYQGIRTTGLEIFADIICRRKLMQGHSLNWWPETQSPENLGNHANKTNEYENILGNMFQELLNRQLLYNRDGTWILRVEEQQKLALDKIKNRHFLIIPEKTRASFRRFFERPHFWAVSSGGQSSRYSSWFITSALLLNAIGDSGNKSSFQTLLMIDGLGMKALSGMILLGLQLLGDIPVREIVSLKSSQRAETFHFSDCERFGLSANPGHYRCDTPPMGHCKRLIEPFANKLWNAARFVAIHTEPGEEENVDFTDGNPIDLWFAHLLTNHIERINDLMEQYRVNEALILTRNLFQKDFANWYLQMIKPWLDNSSTRAFLRFFLKEFLLLLHPFLPALCRNIGKRLFNESTIGDNVEYPSFDSNMIFPEKFSRVELLRELIRYTRRLREEIGIGPALEFAVTLYSKSKNERDMLVGLIPSFNQMTGSREAVVAGEFTPGHSMIQGRHANWKLLFTFASAAETTRIRKRLEQELAHISDKIDKLENRAFSPTTKKSLQELFKRKERINTLIDDIS